MAKKTNKADAQTIAKAYMNAVLNNGSAPKSVHAFCKENGLEETDFFNAFGSFTYLEKKYGLCFMTIRLITFTNQISTKV